MAYKLIALCGKAGSGKDTILKKIIEINPQIHEVVSCTTRPPREGEKHGVNYYFLDNETFAKKMYNNEMLEATVFRDWCYGTSLESLDKDKINIGVFNPEGIDLLRDDPRVHMTVFYIKASGKVRLQRQLNRETEPDVDEIVRRYETDKHDFIWYDETKNPHISDFIPLVNESKTDLIDCVNYILDKGC